MNLVERALHDLVHTRQLPVDRIDMLADGDIAEVLRHFDRQDFVGIGGFGVAQIGRAEQAHGMSGQRFQQALRRIHFQRHGFGRNVGQVGVGVGMAADVVAVFEDALDNPRIGFRIRIDEEECAGNVFLLEDVENLRRPFRIRPVVESERDFLFRRAELLDHIAGRQFGIGLVVDVAEFLVALECPRAGLRMRNDLENLAFALIVDIFDHRDVVQAFGGG